MAMTAYLFARSMGQAGDVFLGISTSGRSPNILHALELCREMGIVTIGMTGKQAVRMPPLCDYCIKIPSDVTIHIQEAHLALEHIFCGLVERSYFRAERPAEIEATAVLEE
jgi:D-sedoheptulose 7-phosphate isomerase